jgi:hypothetical protein
MYDNLWEKQCGEGSEDIDSPPASSEAVSADINPDADSLLKLGQEIFRDPSGNTYHAVRFCDLHLFRDK